MSTKGLTLLKQYRGVRYMSEADRDYIGLSQMSPYIIGTGRGVQRPYKVGGKAGKC